MFEKLVELIAATWERLCFLEIVYAYEHTGVLRLGRYHRTLAPGLHWKWPVFEHTVSVPTCVTTQRLAPQTLTTKDGAAVVVAAIIKFQITDIKPYITDIWDQNDVLADVAMGAVRKAVSDSTYTVLFTDPPEDRVLALVRSQVNRYGFKIHAITFTDIGRVRSIRLIQQAPKDLAN